MGRRQLAHSVFRRRRHRRDRHGQAQRFLHQQSTQWNPELVDQSDYAGCSDVRHGFRRRCRISPRGIAEPNGRLSVGARGRAEPHLWVGGYGDWTRYASATLIGVGRMLVNLEYAQGVGDSRGVYLKLGHAW